MSRLHSLARTLLLARSLRTSRDFPELEIGPPARWEAIQKAPPGPMNAAFRNVGELIAELIYEQMREIIDGLKIERDEAVEQKPDSSEVFIVPFTAEGDELVEKDSNTETQQRSVRLSSSKSHAKVGNQILVRFSCLSRRLRAAGFFIAALGSASLFIRREGAAPHPNQCINGF